MQQVFVTLSGGKDGKPVDSVDACSYPYHYEIFLTTEQEARLSHIAVLEGKDADELAREVFGRGLQAEATLIASRPRHNKGQKAAARMLELRQGNLLPEGVSIQDLIRDGRAQPSLFSITPSRRWWHFDRQPVSLSSTPLTSP